MIRLYPIHFYCGNRNHGRQSCAVSDSLTTAASKFVDIKKSRCFLQQTDIFRRYDGKAIIKQLWQSNNYISIYRLSGEKKTTKISFTRRFRLVVSLM